MDLHKIQEVPLKTLGRGLKKKRKEKTRGGGDPRKTLPRKVRVQLVYLLSCLTKMKKMKSF